MDLGVNTPGGTDENVKVSSNDTTASKLVNKLASAGGTIIFTQVNDGSNETLNMEAVAVSPCGGKGVINCPAILPTSGVPIAELFQYSPGSWYGGALFNRAGNNSPATAWGRVPSFATAITKVKISIITNSTVNGKNLTIYTSYDKNGEAEGTHNGYGVYTDNFVSGQIKEIDITADFAGAGADYNMHVQMSSNGVWFIMLGMSIEYTY